MDVPASFQKAVKSVQSSTAPAERITYARDLWPRHLIELRAGQVEPQGPALVTWPQSTDDVVRIVQFARSEGIAVVPFGAGSGVCGGVLPDARTIVIDLKKMNSWRIEPTAPLIDVGPGALGITLEEDLERQGFTIGHFPSSILCSTVGGWIAARGAGQCSGRYGKMEDMVSSLECVLGTGEVVQLHRRVSGPNLIPLMVGSEGTLGVITRAQLRLHPAPRSRALAAFSFADIRKGWNALRELFQDGLRPAVSRLYDPIDSFFLRQGAVKKPKTRQRKSSGHSSSPLKLLLRAPRLLNQTISSLEGNLLGGSTLILVFEGEYEPSRTDCERATEICHRAGGQPLGEGPARSWLQHRYSVSYRQAPVFRMGAFSDTMEVAAPWSKLEQLYDNVRLALGEQVLVMAHLSHAYPDGCSIYFTFSGSASDDQAALVKYDQAWRAALDAAIDSGGTLSHHHGVGRSKAPKLGRELGLGRELVQRVMEACDPSAILNPGNLISRDADSGAPIELSASHSEPVIDEESLLVELPGHWLVQQAEEFLNNQGFTLGLSSSIDDQVTVAKWLAEGAREAGNPWDDPVDQLIVGLVAQLHSGKRLVIRPAPRRAVGPDLIALFRGGKEEIGHIEQATLRVRKMGTPTARVLPFHGDRDPSLSTAESSVWQRIVTTVSES